MSLFSGMAFGGLLAYGATRTSANPKDFLFLLGMGYLDEACRKTTLCIYIDMRLMGTFIDHALQLACYTVSSIHTVTK